MKALLILTLFTSSLSVVTSLECFSSDTEVVGLQQGTEFDQLDEFRSQEL
jgi:hypothetical protein